MGSPSADLLSCNAHWLEMSTFLSCSSLAALGATVVPVVLEATVTNFLLCLSKRKLWFCERGVGSWLFLLESCQWLVHH